MTDLSSSSSSSLHDDYIAASANRPLVVDDDHNEQPSSTKTAAARWSWLFKVNSTSSSESCRGNDHVVVLADYRGENNNNNFYNAPSLLDDALTQEIEFFNQVAAPASAATNRNHDIDEEQQEGGRSSSFFSIPDLGSLWGSLPPAAGDHLVSVDNEQQTPTDLVRIESFVLALRRFRSGRRRTTASIACRQKILMTLVSIMLLVVVMVAAVAGTYSLSGAASTSQQDHEQGGAPAKRIWDWYWGAIRSMIMRVKEAARKLRL
jgi:hypothetical protein